ncbi:MAG TPA: flavodoxin-dependent (E)-4-hydroxy-3-methylbut-2-enyl-diphosphate synthase [Sediminispirochaeta sp.]|nr:flavodoxin-dependent (E)-4-hydroxy-3-methylbut-2-enyl-diphosphate synthase [Sediminispirochaeta sp.]
MRSKKIYVRDLAIGGDAPVSVQTMWKEALPQKMEELRELAARLSAMKSMGCDLVRFAVPDSQAAEALIRLREISPLPLVADIHYDYRLALTCIHGGVDKIRINPGNIGAEWKVRELILAARDREVPIRIGVNSGSLPKKLQAERDVASAMIKAAEQEIEVFERHGFSSLVCSLKASDINTTVAANEGFAARYPIPLHLGVTEAGPLIPGIVKSSVAMVRLLDRGIGNTIRVSLSDSPEKEILTGLEILDAAGMAKKRPKIVSCPRCGRAGFDTHGFVEKISPILYSMDKEVSVAVMGCVVNGPGEARHADLGITGAGREIIIFKHGKILRRVNENRAFEVFVEELKKL